MATIVLLVVKNVLEAMDRPGVVGTANGIPAKTNVKVTERFQNTVN